MLQPAYPQRPLGAVGVIPSLARPPMMAMRGPVVPTIIRRPINTITPVEKPITTVYVGKIASSVDNEFMLSLFVDPTTGALKGFGFCEFRNVEGVLCALRLLSKLSIGGQELMEIEEAEIELDLIQKEQSVEESSNDVTDWRKLPFLAEDKGFFLPPISLDMVQGINLSIVKDQGPDFCDAKEGQHFRSMGPHDSAWLPPYSVKSYLDSSYYGSKRQQSGLLVEYSTVFQESETATLDAISKSKFGNWMKTFDTSSALDKLRKSLQLERIAMYHHSNRPPWKVDKKWEDLSPKD
ncbi:unnamed protein product [Lactuca saligna]|uniref:RRM domain-containing protein n=1 Tax=Lactuca saligna TaxID=75948 RepID=A0AA35Y7Y4_LACSI|nr:unnamed protein product [Lactuca saligna]